MKALNLVDSINTAAGTGTQCSAPEDEQRSLASSAQVRCHPCPLCWTVFAQEAEVQQHMRSHTQLTVEQWILVDSRPFVAGAKRRADGAGREGGEQGFRCLYCEEAFASTSEVRVHARQTHKNLLPVEAPEGGGISEQKKQAENPGKESLLVEKAEEVSKFAPPELKSVRYQCSHCEKSFLKSWKLEEHLTVHSGKRPFACWFCTLSFKGRHHLKNHMSKVHGSETNALEQKAPDFPPPSSSDSLQFYSVYQQGISALDSFISQMPSDCSQGNTDDPDVDFPEIISTEWFSLPEDGKYRIALSPRIFEKLGERLAQRANSKSADPSGVCPHCRKIFLSLPTHLPDCPARTDDEGRQECHQCGKTFQNLNTHACHSDDARSECPYCRRSFVRLRKHMKHCYKGCEEPCEEAGEEGKEACPYCHKTFVFVSTHMKHCRKMPYELEDEFSDSETREVCQYCQKSFTRLKKHQWYCPMMKEHGKSLAGSEKRHRCYYCEAAYFKRQSVRHHMRSKHAAELSASNANGDLLDSPHDSDPGIEPELRKQAIRKDIRSLREPRKEDLKMNAHGTPVCKSCGHEFADMHALRVHQKLEKKQLRSLQRS